MLVCLQQGLRLSQTSLDWHSLWSRNSSPRSALPGPACTTDTNTAGQEPSVTSAIILICSSSKTTASQASSLHELQAPNRKELFPSSFHTFLPQQRVLAKLSLTDCTGIKKYYLGASGKHIPPEIFFLLLTLDLIPAFSTKPFLCMSAMFQAIWALLLNIVFEVLRLCQTGILHPLGGDAPFLPSLFKLADGP